MGDGAMTQSLESWMTHLPSPLKNYPIVYLAIPGSHDSMTYTITSSSDVSPDAEPIMKRLYPLFRGTILRWTITQQLDVYQQLLIGIRYFDLRIATRSQSDQFFFVHGLYGAEISKPLEQIKEFLNSHPEEVVILDFQHFYAFTEEDHHRLIYFILNLFGDILYPKPGTAESVTLNSMARRNKQVIGIYRDKTAFSSVELWSGFMLPTPWPAKDSVDGLLAFLKGIRRRPGTGFVHQAVLTPTPAFILLRFIFSLRDRCAIPVKNRVLPVIANFSPGVPQPSAESTVNVVIADFVELDGAIFSKTIIGLNQKILQQIG